MFLTQLSKLDVYFMFVLAQMRRMMMMATVTLKRKRTLATQQNELGQQLAEPQETESSSSFSESAIVSQTVMSRLIVLHDSLV